MQISTWGQDATSTWPSSRRCTPSPRHLSALQVAAQGMIGGLRLLRDRLGDRFVGGFVLNLGELAYRKEAKIAITPLSTLWS